MVPWPAPCLASGALPPAIIIIQGFVVSAFRLQNYALACHQAGLKIAQPVVANRCGQADFPLQMLILVEFCLFGYNYFDKILNSYNTSGYQRSARQILKGCSPGRRLPGTFNKSLTAS